MDPMEKLDGYITTAAVSIDIPQEFVTSTTTLKT